VSILDEAATERFDVACLVGDLEEAAELLTLGLKSDARILMKTRIGANNQFASNARRTRATIRNLPRESRAVIKARALGVFPLHEFGAQRLMRIGAQERCSEGPLRVDRGGTGRAEELPPRWPRSRPSRTIDVRIGGHLVR